MSRGMLRCWTLDSPWHAPIRRRLLTGGWIVVEGVKLLPDISIAVVFMSLDSSEDTFDVSHAALLVDSC